MKEKINFDETSGCDEVNPLALLLTNLTLLVEALTSLTLVVTTKLEQASIPPATGAHHCKAEACNKPQKGCGSDNCCC